MTDLDGHIPKETLSDTTDRISRRVGERAALGLAALVVALFGCLGLTQPDQGTRGDGQRGRIQAEAPAPDRVLAGELRTDRRSPDGLDLGGASALPAPAAAVIQLTVPVRIISFPASTPAPALPRLWSPRVPTGPPSIIPA